MNAFCDDIIIHIGQFPIEELLADSIDERKRRVVDLMRFGLQQTHCEQIFLHNLVVDADGEAIGSLATLDRKPSRVATTSDREM